MKHLIFAVSFLIIGSSLLAQKDSSHSTERKIFNSQIVAGITEGFNGTSFQLQTINGFRKGTWFAGLGTGLDYYLYRSVPVFLSGTKYLSRGNHSFFVQGDGGVNFAWVNTDLNRWNNVIKDEFSPGLYWNSSFGFSTGMGSSRNALQFSLGYSYKHLKEIKEVAIFCINPPCPAQVENYSYHLRRLSLRIGWQFNAVH
jgi:hypothetical protein